MREAKQALRERITANRSALNATALSVHARALRDVLVSVPEVVAAERVAAYVSVGDEPGTGPLIEELHDRGVHVLLPILLPDFDLDWAEYQGPASLAPARRGLLEPIAPRLGPEAVREADVVLVPAMAVDRRGTRLGKGGGCYDRVLSRLAGRAPAYVLLHDGEVLDMPIPHEPHDVRVNTVVTPSGIQHVGDR
ncbi:5-formyltetrahydrofolate cyclo-ligase [Phytoactinopolyspora halotolerans]|uniref:5-formyltetrahydrofolate cyclo-ligase n=1 Tax=Phytoactinopolyspora halotolerans TaxID=1981512 RepID=A0A6L9S8W7_9ACTN|nr:5-formyltetrahydrofolate cyclo-ligase [Phytoactinopolyspora halotolerans]